MITKIEKAIIPAAGLGTRLLPVTKEMPKEMLPIYFKINSNSVVLKPLLQIIFETLYEIGFHKFCFIVGRGKRAIEDHFTPDYKFLEFLKLKGKENIARDLSNFYKKVESSVIVWVNQPEPKGFGDAILRAMPFVENDYFLVHAGDTLIFPREDLIIHKMLKLFLEKNADVIFIVKKVENPRIYGVIESSKREGELIRVDRIIEKPEIPPSNLAVVPIYIFTPLLFKALKNIKLSKRGELELTDAIQKIIEWNGEVYAIELKNDFEWLDIGTPITYWKALSISYGHVFIEK